MSQKFIPMLFSTLMVEALLNGTKTETRRIVKLPKDYDGKNVYLNGSLGLKYTSSDFEDCVKRLEPKVNVGDIIWVRETFQITDFLHPSDGKPWLHLQSFRKRKRMAKQFRKLDMETIIVYAKSSL